MLEIGKSYKVIIERQDNFGLGIAKIDGMLVFVERGLPGEEVVIQITDIKKKYARGKVIKIDKSSKFRIGPICPYYESCGGCQLMHENYLGQLEFKREKIRALFERNFKVDSIKFNDIIYGKEFNYRNKVVFHGDGDELGFYKEKTNVLLPIDKCLLADKEINNIYDIVRNYIFENKGEVINEIMIRRTSLNEVMVNIMGNINYQKLIKLFPNCVTSIYFNGKNIYGKKTIREVINDFNFEILPQAFFQVNYQMMNKLYNIIVDYYKKNNYDNVLDLYCGTGTIGILVSPYVKKVVGIEVVEDAIASAKINKKINNIDNIDFRLGKVEKYIDSFSNIDSIIVDPPRSGLDNITIASILKINPYSIVYTSCDPMTLVRDLKILTEKYDIKEANVVDMFPNTYHVECVLILHRKNIEK